MEKYRVYLTCEECALLARHLGVDEISAVKWLGSLDEEKEANVLRLLKKKLAEQKQEGWLD